MTTTAMSALQGRRRTGLIARRKAKGRRKVPPANLNHSLKRERPLAPPIRRRLRQIPGRPGRLGQVVPRLRRRRRRLQQHLLRSRWHPLRPNQLLQYGSSTRTQIRTTTNSSKSTLSRRRMRVHHHRRHPRRPRLPHRCLRCLIPRPLARSACQRLRG